MEKKSKAQVFLERVEMLDAVVESKLIEQRQWKDLALNITANMGGDRVQSTASKSKMADAVEKCILMEDEIADAVDKLIEEKQSVVKTIEQLYSPMEYKVLHLKYIQYLSYTDIAEKLGKDYTWVTTTHGRAVKHIQNILDRE